MENTKLISIVVPMYNECEGLHGFFDVLFPILNKIEGYKFEVVVVNDGSKDNTYELLQKEQENHKEIVLVNLSRNFGHEPAVAAGLRVASGDAVIPMDADLQDPPEIIPELIKKFEEGYDVVNAKRASRKDDTAFKRNTAGLFYKIIAKWSGKVKVAENVGHYRLMSRRVVDQVIALNDYVRVLRVEVPYVGYKTTQVEFVRAPRLAGKTHYNLKSMTDLAVDSIVSTTPQPLKLIKGWAICMGVIAVLSTLVELVLFILDLCNVTHLGGLSLLAWLVINVLLIVGTVIMVSLAIMAEYQARTFLEAQKRPFFIIESVVRK
ncbi:MAG: glycosyltransferase family 2 protein [Bacilli bacterium]|nr:glycosyltransferase family 2 protein [Bacilli bacterium]